MKPLICEMCGNSDLIKNEGVFVCQSCGVKYSIEEARKMMIEGTVDVKGTVQVDNSAFVKKYLENARRAKEKEDWEETEKYYNMVEQNDPNNIEAIFYSAYGKAKASLVDADIYKRQAAFNVLKNCISIIDDKYDMERADENRDAIIGMAADINNMITSNFVFNVWRNSYGNITRTNKNETYTLFSSLIDAFRESINNIIKVDNRPYLHGSLILVYCAPLSVDYWNNSQDTRLLLRKWIKAEREEFERTRQIRLDTYWAEHNDEKQQLETEAEALSKQVADLSAQIDALPENTAVASCETQISNAIKEREALKVFKVKERKELQAQIDSLNMQLTALQEQKVQAKLPFDEQIQPMQTRINEINARLSISPFDEDISLTVAIKKISAELSLG